MAELRDNALLIRTIPYSDSSLIAHCFTQHHGRISLMVRGARRAKSPFRAGLMPLYQLQIRWKEPRTGSMGTLLEVQRLDSLVPESKMLSAQSLLSKGNALFPDGVDHGYDELYAALQVLSARDEASGLPAALWHMLSASGLVSDFEHCWHCSSQIDFQQHMYWFRAHSLCETCARKRGLILSSGFRKSVTGNLDNLNIKLSPDYIETWHKMIDQTMAKNRSQ